MNRKGNWLQTYSGRKFWPLDPRPEEVDLNDIAHALSNLCRFAGHSLEFYSVAQHSVLVSQIVPPKAALWGLLHDAAEAYCVDLPRPIKHDPGAAWYREVEQRIMCAVCERFGLAPVQPASVSWADQVLLSTERRDLMTHSPGWHVHERPLIKRIEPWAPKEARHQFIQRAEELGLAYRGAA